DPELLRHLLVTGQGVGCLIREWNEAGAERRVVAGAKATVDVASAVDMYALPTGDGVQRNGADIPLHTQGLPARLQPLLILAINELRVRPEARREVVGPRLENIGAEQARGALQSTPVDVE